MKFFPSFKNIYYDENIDQTTIPKDIARSIMAGFPEATVKKVSSHIKVNEVWDSDPANWFKTKNENLILGIKKSLNNEPNNNSSDFIAPSHVNGCLASCQYCYVARHKGGGNPVTVFVNGDQIAGSIINHSNYLGKKLTPNQQDDKYWIYDIGCNSDNSIDALYSPIPKMLIEKIAYSNNAKLTFATKYVNEEAWLNLDHKGRTRIRYSLMPEQISKTIDIRTSPIKDRIKSINNLVDAGYEVHLNFSPVVIYEGWREDWVNLFKQIDEVLTDKSKSQLKCEVIFLTHSANLHEKNMAWNPKGEEYLWKPDWQEDKGRNVLRYKLKYKSAAIKIWKELVETNLPYCKIRYIF